MFDSGRDDETAHVTGGPRGPARRTIASAVGAVVAAVWVVASAPATPTLAAPVVAPSPPTAAPPAPAAAAPSLASGPEPAERCVASDGVPARAPDPEYYSFDLLATGAEPGFDAGGRVRVVLAPSPFGVPTTRDGSLVHRLTVTVGDVRVPAGRRMVAWVTPPALEPVRRLGPVEPGSPIEAEVSLEKYLVFVTLEPASAGPSERWTGPVVLEGKSRSNRMRSRASHGTLEPEPC